MDAITLLKNDHQTVEQLFKRFEKAGDHAHVEKRQVVDRFIEELSRHAAIEEQLFYPVARATVPGTDDIALESLEEHHIVKWLLSELEKMDPADERFDAKVTVLMENVRHHVAEEERDFFPKVRARLGRNALAELGDAMATAKKSAPTHPHPTAPDTPPGNLAAGTAVGVMDRVGDTVAGIAQGSVTAIQDLVARILHLNRRQPAPTGSSVTRRQAEKVRAEASDATDAVLDAVLDTIRSGEKATEEAAATVSRVASTAKRGAVRTARTATAGARATARTAKSGARATTTAARSATGTTTATAKRASTATRRKARSASSGTVKTAKRAASKTAANR